MDSDQDGVHMVQVSIETQLGSFADLQAVQVKVLLYSC